MFAADQSELRRCYVRIRQDKVPSSKPREKALVELAGVFEMIAEEFREKGKPLPADTTEIMHA